MKLTRCDGDRVRTSQLISVLDGHLAEIPA